MMKTAQRFLQPEEVRRGELLDVPPILTWIFCR
jgi:hypothetical protein